jgi:hypothetical protein
MKTMQILKFLIVILPLLSGSCGRVRSGIGGIVDNGDKGKDPTDVQQGDSAVLLPDIKYKIFASRYEIAVPHYYVHDTHVNGIETFKVAQSVVLRLEMRPEACHTDIVETTRSGSKVFKCGINNNVFEWIVELSTGDFIEFKSQIDEVQSMKIAESIK